jgi:hypothetical protein
MLTVRQIRSVKIVGDMDVIQAISFQLMCTNGQMYKVKY